MCHYGISTVLLFNPKNLAGYPSRLFSFVPEPVTGTSFLTKKPVVFGQFIINHEMTLNKNKNVNQNGRAGQPSIFFHVSVNAP